MIAYGFPGLTLASEFDLVEQIGADVVEFLPNWSAFPSSHEAKNQAADRGIRVHSTHGCWGGQTIKAQRVDLGAADPATHRGSIDDLKRCIDWLEEVGGTCLVIHPGGLSQPDETEVRRSALRDGLNELAEHASEGNTILCVENMPPGVWPGSRMESLHDLVVELGHPRVSLALDTGHARLVSAPEEETRAAGPRLRTTHVHDNDGRRDLHLPPGEGIVDWAAWGASLDEIGYTGPILLECIRELRRHPEKITPAFFEILDRLTGRVV